jgi:hypothetical protein
MPHFEKYIVRRTRIFFFIGSVYPICAKTNLKKFRETFQTPFLRFLSHFRGKNDRNELKNFEFKLKLNFFGHNFVFFSNIFAFLLKINPKWFFFISKLIIHDNHLKLRCKNIKFKTYELGNLTNRFWSLQ